MEETYSKAVSGIITAMSDYKENHQMRHGSITDSLVNSLIAVEKMRKEQEQVERTKNALLADRARWKEEKERAVSLYHKEAEKTDSPIEM